MSSPRTPSDHFANGRFFNPGASPQQFWKVLQWLKTRKPGHWPEFVVKEPGPKPLERVDGDELVVTFVNHSTFLLQTCGLNLLTDPVWSERASPLHFLGPKRHRNPGLRFGDLPRIDGVLISHNHYDHLDVPTLGRLATRDRPAVFCPLGVAPLLRRAGFREIHEMDWWESMAWRGMEVHCVPAQHFASRTPFDRDKTLWCGWVFGRAPLRAGEGVYFAGDTGFGEFFRRVGERFPRVRLALLPIGAFQPEWFMGPVHMSPEQAVQAHEQLGAGLSVATHFGTFALADDGMHTPVEHLRSALANRNLSAEEFLVLEGGRALPVPRNPERSSAN